MGLKSLPDELCLYVSKLATLPVALELRIGLDESDALCESFALSFYLARKPLRAADLAQLFCEGGPGWRALAWFEEWGIADERWRVVADAGFAKMVPFMRDGGARCRMALLCSPVCFMMPWEKDCPLPAKAYVSFRGRMLP